MIRIRLIALLGLLAIARLAAQPSPQDLFERARMLEESNRNLPEAIALYAQVAEQSTERHLAATAQLRVGLLHERLGQKAEAQRAFRTVVANYPDVPDIAKRARERLPNGGAQETGELRTRRVWEGPDAQFFGSPSPDGRHVSFIDWTSGDVALRELATGRHRRLTSRAASRGGGNGLYSRISPNGNEIVFNWFEADGSSDLRITRIDTLKTDVIYRNEQLGYIQPFDWSHDGQQILVLFGRPDRTNQIAVISRASKGARVVKTLDWRQPMTMSFSSDAQWIAYDLPQQDGRPERDVFLLAADGSRETPLVQHAADDFVLGWAPNNQTVLFASDRTGSLSAWMVPVDAGRPVGAAELVRGDLGRRVYPLGFSQTGSFFYFTSTEVSDLYTTTLSTDSSDAAVRPVPVGARYVGTNESADWSHDGRYLAVISQQTGAPGRRLIIRSVTGDDERELQPDLAIFSWPRWNPTDSAILVSGRDRKNRPGFFTINAVSGQVKELVRWDQGVRSSRPEWAPDGTHLFYVRKDSNCSCVVKRSLTTNAETMVFRMPPSDLQVRLAVSSDGQKVAVLHNDTGRPTLSVVDVPTGQPRVLFQGNDLAWLAFVTWSSNGREILFGRTLRASNVVEMWAVPLAGGQATKTPLAATALRDLRMHPDSRRVVFSAGEDKSEVWVMENFLPTAQPSRR